MFVKHYLGHGGMGAQGHKGVWVWVWVCAVIPTEVGIPCLGEIFVGTHKCVPGIHAGDSVVHPQMPLSEAINGLAQYFLGGFSLTRR